MLRIMKKSLWAYDIEYMLNAQVPCYNIGMAKSFNSPKKPPLTEVNTSTPRLLRQTIQMLLLKNNEEPVIDWLNSAAPSLDADLLEYVWTQSVRCNQTQRIGPWLKAHFPAQMEDIKTRVDVVKLLSSPRAWTALKTLDMAPTLSDEQIKKVLVDWNKSALSTATNFRIPAKRILHETYFQECAHIHVSFLEHYVPSYSHKMNILNTGIASGRMASLQNRLPNDGYESNDEHSVLLRARATAMAESSSPDLWLLATMCTHNMFLSCLLSQSDNISTWWHPLLNEVYAGNFTSANWQRRLNTSNKSEVSEHIAVAAHLTMGHKSTPEQLKSMLSLAETTTMAAPEHFDLPANALE